MKILIHGFTGHRDYWPNPQLRPVLLDAEHGNVISVDYGPLVYEPCYAEAVGNAPLVSRCLAQLIDNLISQRIVSNELLHLIGFSLGSQVAGQTANFVSRKLKHITGLDPAKPLFSSAPTYARLDAGDAEFVDVIHTNVLERGILASSGHVDFYPNFKYPIQPGCEQDEFPGSCSHNRAVEFYAESIPYSQGFWGRQCESWATYLLGWCSQRAPVALMGYHAKPNLRGSFFLQTARQSPYILGLGGAEHTDSSINFVEQVDQTLENIFLQKMLNEINKSAMGCGR